MSKIDRTRRPRRIAADEAHAWARNLKLGNVHAKLILSMLTLYVNGEGTAFVGIAELAEDCELSASTVRRRLGWLEEVGAIARVPQWLDENGNRNSQGCGKRTTDLIKLLIESDLAIIEDLAAGGSLETSVKSTSISPSQQQGLDIDENQYTTNMLISPTPALCQPSHCGQGLISEPEPEQESDRIIDARASGTKSSFTEGSKALATAFWKAVGFDQPIDIPPEFAGVDWRAIQWEQAGWTADLIDAEARRIARDKPLKPLSYFEKVFATAFAKRQAPLPIVEVGGPIRGSPSRPLTEFQRAQHEAKGILNDLRHFASGSGRSDRANPGLLSDHSGTESEAIRRGSDEDIIDLPSSSYRSSD